MVRKLSLKIGIGMGVFNMNFNEFSRIIQTIDYLLELEENGQDIYPVLISWKVAFKRDNPKFTERLE